MKYRITLALVLFGIKIAGKCDCDYQAFVHAAKIGDMDTFEQMINESGCHPIGVPMEDYKKSRGYDAPSGTYHPSGSTLQEAAANGQHEVINYVMEHLSRFPFSKQYVPREKLIESLKGALFQAILNDDIETVKLLHRYGANIHGVERDKILDGSFFYGLEKAPMLAAGYYGSAECIKYFIAQGVNVNALHLAGETALYYAEKNGHEKAAAILREAKACICPLRQGPFDRETMGPKKSLIGKMKSRWQRTFVYRLYKAGEDAQKINEEWREIRKEEKRRGR